MIDPAVERQTLKEEFERQADWRRQKAEEYPEDARNLKAAERYDRLAAVDVRDEQIIAYAECFLDGTEQVVELHQEFLHRPFHQDAFASAGDFVRVLITRVTQGGEPRPR